VSQNLKAGSYPMQWSPTFLAPGMGFLAGNFSTDWEKWWFQDDSMRYIYHAVYFYYYYISFISDHDIRSEKVGDPCREYITPHFPVKK